jgi:hypothetical protein
MVVTFAVVILIGAGPSQAGDCNPPAGPGMHEFMDDVNAYIALRHRLQQTLPPLEVSPDAERVRRAADALATAVRAARRGARVGEIFTSVARWEFRRVIRDTLNENHYAVEDLLSDLSDDIPPDASPPDIRIDHSFPWEFGTATPPSLLAALPALPEALEYKFIGRDLLLVDIDADLAIDVLPAALASPAHRSLTS